MRWWSFVHRPREEGFVSTKYALLIGGWRGIDGIARRIGLLTGPRAFAASIPGKYLPISDTIGKLPIQPASWIIAERSRKPQHVRRAVRCWSLSPCGPNHRRAIGAIAVRPRSPPERTFHHLVAGKQKHDERKRGQVRGSQQYCKLSAALSPGRARCRRKAVVVYS